MLRERERERERFSPSPYPQISVVIFLAKALTHVGRGDPNKCTSTSHLGGLGVGLEKTEKDNIMYKTQVC